MAAVALARETPVAPRRLLAGDRPIALALAIATLLAAGAWAIYVRSGAHLLHFDAKAHLVVARRTIDNLTPGWTQLGAIWLPLPHILNALPAQSDALYASGIFASGLSFVAFVIALVALARAARSATGDPWAALVALAVPAFNPGWLYLQSTPLIEALFLAGVSAALAGYAIWHVEHGRRALWLGVVCSGLACWVRYEAWPLLTLTGLWLVAAAPRVDRRRVAALVLGGGVVIPILAYGIHSWVASGIPFYAIGSENLTERRGDLPHALSLAWTGVTEAFGTPLIVSAALALAVIARRIRRDPLAAFAVAALAPLAVTLIAYLAGHPPKARYPLLIAPALGLALAAATRERRVAQALVGLIAALQIFAVPKPLPVMREATRDRRDVAERLPVLDAFCRQYDGGRLLVSMGSLAPVLFELGQRGVPLRNVVHEGNGSWWEYAIVDPAREVGWIIIAKGDVLDDVRRVRSRFPEGFVPVLRFRGVTIYRRDNGMGGMTPLTAAPASL
jgi:hypothetical protein